MAAEYFKGLAYAESEEMTKNVCENLRRCLEVRGLTHSDFVRWAMAQGISEVKESRLRMYYANKAKSDHLVALCLTATYMNKAPQEVFFHILDRKKFK